tara:strand:- start:645 stop:836 length:192 start_codon:yes stop_codon:yes gene_type:complete
MTIKVTFTDNDSETIGTIELSSGMSSAICLSTVEGMCQKFREEFNSISCDPLNFTITYHNEDI